MAADKDIKDYLHRMLIPPGFRPQSEEDLEKALDIFDKGPLDADSVSRILGKAKGEIPLRYESMQSGFGVIEEGVESDELLALHRSESDIKSEEVQKKLEKYRQQAKEQEISDDEKKPDVD